MSASATQGGHMVSTSNTTQNMIAFDDRIFLMPLVNYIITVSVKLSITDKMIIR